MNFLSNMRISHKISALMIGLIVGFIVIGVTYYVQINIENDNLATERQMSQFRTQLAEANVMVSELLSHGRAYVQDPNAEAEQTYSNALIDTRQQLQALHASLDSQEQKEAIGNILDQIDAYDTQFQQTVLQQKQIGYDNNTGINAEIIQNMDALNALLLQEGQVQLIPIVKAFVEQPSESETAVESFNTQVDKLGLTQDTAGSLTRAFEITLGSASQLRDLEAKFNSAAKQLSDQDKILNNRLSQLLADSYSDATTAVAADIEQRQIIQAVVTAIIFVVAMGTAIGVYFLYKSIVFPMVHMQSVIGKINRGKTGSRVKVLTQDELGDLGKAFNQLLDERIKQLEDRSLENDQLNNSIIGLIQALGIIAQKDLTVKVPVSPDITGTISDAVNLLTTETARTLQDVKGISEQVNQISLQLQDQSNLVMEYADGEKRQIIAAAKALEMLARAMNDVAANAETADANASKAIESTQQARHSVVETVDGIRAIRETISETEKRTKRLGERSQEISGIVNLINTIAERTHILALNASMHAASAGEAGRGFAVVADEVQRLAENARQSTDEIASMVNNMRVETSDTVAIMSKLISQVADGSRLAEMADQRMAETESATQSLVTDVKNIAQQAVQQAEIANRVRDRSSIIRKFSDKTGQQLEEQRHKTESLRRFADTLVEQVNVFTLPESAKSSRAFAQAKVETRVEKSNAQEEAPVLIEGEIDQEDALNGNVSPLHAAG